MKVEIKLPSELQALAGRLRANDELWKAVVPVIDEQNKLTISEIQEKRLRQTGPESLGVRTSRLWKSIRKTKAVAISGGVVSAIGSNVKYLGVHEFGFDQEVSVRPYMRKRVAKRIIFGSQRKVRLGDVPVRAHKMHMKLKERAPLRRGIFSRREAYGEAIKTTIVNFYGGQKNG